MKPPVVIDYDCYINFKKIRIFQKLKSKMKLFQFIRLWYSSCIFIFVKGVAYQLRSICLSIRVPIVEYY